MVVSLESVRGDFKRTLDIYRDATANFSASFVQYQETLANATAARSTLAEKEDEQAELVAKHDAAVARRASLNEPRDREEVADLAAIDYAIADLKKQICINKATIDAGKSILSAGVSALNVHRELGLHYKIEYDAAAAEFHAARDRRIKMDPAYATLVAQIQ